MLGPGQGKLHVAASAEGETFGGGLADGEMFFHGSGEAIEAFRGYCYQKLIFAGEVAIWGVVRDSRAARNFAKGEGSGANFANQCDGGVEKGLAEIDVVVRLGIGHSMF